MMKFTVPVVLVNLLFLTVASYLPDAQAQEVSMWEGVTKTNKQLEADRELIESLHKSTNGNLRIAANRGIKLGWQAIENGNSEKAIRRFNQVWLLNPKRGEIYWGFAVATAMRGDDLQIVEKWFRKAEEIVGPHWRLHSDWGRWLELRDEPERAIPHFLKSIEANPKYPEPHVGMFRASEKLGDRSTAEKHRRIYYELTKN
jgi:Flp pilus assembly protein TadD